MREYEVPPLVAIPSGTTPLAALAERAGGAPRSTAIRVSRFGRWVPVTCEQLLDEAVAMAKGIAAAGVQPGDRIAIASGNRAESIVLEFAIWQAGAISVPICPSASPGRLEWILADSGAVGLFVGTAGQRERFRALSSRLPQVRQVWCVDEGDLWPLAEAGQIVGDDDLHLRRSTVQGATAATISYPCADTERAVGCVLTHAGLAYQAETIARSMPEVFHGEASLLVSRPQHDSFGRIVQLAALRAGAEYGVCDGLDLLEEFRRFRPTVIVTSADLLAVVIDRARTNAERSRLGMVFDRAAQCAVRVGRSRLSEPGPRLRLRLEHAAFGPLVFRNLRDDFGGRLEYVLLHDGAADPDVAAFFRGLDLGVLRGHGAREAGGVSHLELPGAARAGSVGRALPGTATRIHGADEVQLRGPGLFDGYWNNESATIEALDADGWLATGDTGSLDDDGFLYLRSRTELAAIAHPARLPADSARP